MARIHGRHGRLYVGLSSSASAAEPVTFLSNWSLDSSVDNVDVTAFGDSNKVYVAGLPDASGSFSGFFDDATAQVYTAASDGDARRFYLYPDSRNGTAGPYWYGTALFDFSVQGAVDGAVQVSGNLQAASTVTKIG